MSKEIEGKVKFFNSKKGYGFILGDDEKEYFFHFSQLINVNFIKTDDRVSFIPSKSDRGIQATKVNVI